MFISRLVARSLIAVTLVVLGGCTFYATGPMSVDIRDARTTEPVGDAVVVVRALYLYEPAWPHDVRFPPPVGTVRAVTDTDGRCRFDAVSCPSRIFVYHAGHVPQHVDLDELPSARDDTSEWRPAQSAGTDGDVDGTLDVRLSGGRGAKLKVDS